MARCLVLGSESNWSLYETAGVVWGSEGRCLRMLFIEDEPGELLCWGGLGRGALANRLSSELASVEEGRVDVEPC